MAVLGLGEEVLENERRDSCNARKNESAKKKEKTHKDWGKVKRT